MKRKRGSRLRIFMWVIILIFLAAVISFPKWITIFYPLSDSELVFPIANEYEVDPYLVFAIIRAESKYQTSAESPVGARGLMQIMPETAVWIAQQMKIEALNPDDLHDPELNISLGCWYLKDLDKEFGGNLPLTVAAYNAGRGKVNQWRQEGKWDGDPGKIENIPFEETRQYVKNVLSNYAAYQAIYVK